MKKILLIFYLVFVFLLFTLLCSRVHAQVSVTSEIGVGIGTGITTDYEKHNFIVSVFDIEYKLSNKWSGVVDLLFADQYSPKNRYLGGGSLLLRYNFEGEKLIPFLNVGAGLSLTNIGEPDLGGSTQFNLQGGGGVHYHIAKTISLTGECRWFHLSSAGIHRPNHGTNSLLLMTGLEWRF